MDHMEAGKFWNENAETWTYLARSGYDIYRDHLNTPAFFAILPDVKNLYGLDIGCGEGYNTRLLAKRGTIMEAIDISEGFIQKAIEEENGNPLNIHYQVASAVDLPFENDSFDFVTAFMSLQDVPETEEAIKEAYRVLKPEGFLQFSITHPCFTTPHRKNLRDVNRKTYAVEVGQYFRNPNGDLDEWVFSTVPVSLKMTLPKFKIPQFNRTLSQWFNILIETGFIIEKINEPYPDDETIQKVPKLQDAQVVAYFLHIRCRKP
jgi:ubiquinone/menaquinone biosynthesis C-methylase UbiE